MSSTDNQQYYRLASYSSQSTPVEGTATGETTQGGASEQYYCNPNAILPTYFNGKMQSPFGMCFCATGGHNHGERYGPA
ncbi:hypothetical protein V865_004019 [Kwoniella europaea PYCC6329]|uniref:Uncharacterized protein n=1 Tax=Kwoniella europaea PYCC6329 TaxID=1423913 RepID=A0AAX4KIS6_9TREE